MDRTEHLRFMREELRYLGITDFPEKEVADQIISGKDKIRIDGKLEFSEYGKKQEMDYSVFLKNYERPNRYHAYQFLATVKGEQEKTRAFHIRPDAHFNMKDAFNLLNGRAVQKLTYDTHTHKMENQWFQLDPVLKDIHGNAKIERFKLSRIEDKVIASLNAFPIRQMMNPAERVNLILSLFNGNAEPVNILHNGKDLKGFVAASPRQNSVQVHTVEDGKLVRYKVNPPMRIKPKNKTKSI